VAAELIAARCLRGRFTKLHATATGASTGAATELAIPAIFERHAAQRGDSPAVTVGSDRLSFGQLYERASQVAVELMTAGVDFGDFVAIALPNSTDFYVAALAAWLVGATPLPLSSALPPAEFGAIVEIAAPKVVLRPGDALLAAGQPAGSARCAVTSSAATDLVAPTWKAQTSGGSTGRPKVIVSTRPAVFDPLIGRSMRIGPDDTCLVPGPLYHSAPFIYSMYGLFAGAHQVVMPKFSAREYLEVLGTTAVTWTTVVPTMLSRILREIQQQPALRTNLDQLHTLWHMAAPCPEWLKRAWIELLGPERVWELYGSAEGQEVAIIDGTDWLAHPGSVGRPRGAGAFAILSPDRRPVPAGTVGDIFVRGADQAPPSYRYLGVPPAESVDGWETVGDIGWMAADGYLYVSDRRLDLIISGGVNVYPAEVEAAIDEYPVVGSSAVVGLPDDDPGQRVHAVVQPTGELSVDELLAFLGSRLSRAKVPRSIEFVAEPLRDDAGKVRRSAVREQVIERMRTQA
jgi:bile acid-coenzyme A ligase